MARRKNNKESPIENWFWLLLSGSGGVLFAFGLLDLIKDIGWSPLVAVLTGASITLFAIMMKKFRTETSVAMKKRK